MAVHNAARTLERAVRSIFKQTVTDFEFIIVDDGSDDNTPNLLKKLCSKEKRAVPFRLEKRGLTKALVFGCERARGEFIARMDGDDIAVATRLDRQLKFLEYNTNVVCCGTAAIVMDDAGRPFRYWRPPISHAEIDSTHLKGYGGGVIHPTALFRRSVYESVGGYDPRWELAQDFDLWLRLAEVGQLANLPDCLLFYRQGISAISQKRPTEQLNHCHRIWQEALARRGLNTTDEFPNWSRQDTSDALYFQQAMENSFFKTAIIYAIRLWLAEPTSRQNIIRAFSLAKRWRAFLRHVSV